MNKLTKVGLSALCGSLAAVSAANAGDMTVTGGVDMSWMSKGGGTATAGNPIGMGSNLTFKGSGELDNGWTFDLTVALLNKAAYSASNVNLDMGGLGKLNINQGNSGNGIDAMDDKMPSAWEEPWGMGLGTGIKLVSGVGPNQNIQYTTPTIGGITLVGAMAHAMGASDIGDKETGASSATKGRGYDVTLNINPTFGTEVLSGFNLFVGAHQTTMHVESSQDNNVYEGVGGLTLDIGPISLGYAKSGHVTGLTTTASEVDYYKNTMYGVAFNINDDLSVSYGYHESEQGFVNPNDTENVTADVSSVQVAYSMGGASLRYARSEVNNAAYQTTTPYDKDASVISVSLAF